MNTFLSRDLCFLIKKYRDYFVHEKQLSGLNNEYRCFWSDHPNCFVWRDLNGYKAEWRTTRVNNVVHNTGCTIEIKHYWWSSRLTKNNHFTCTGNRY